MENLESIITNKIEKDNAAKLAHEQKQTELTEEYTRKSNEIVEKLGFLGKYGFSLDIHEYTDWDCGSTCGYRIKRVILRRHDHHVAILYPCPGSDKFDFMSWQLEMNQGWYTYETGVKALVDGRNFSGF